MKRSARNKHQATAKLTLRIVGPIERNTFQREASDPVLETIDDLFHWSSSTRLQIRRLARDLPKDFKAFSWQPGLRRRRRFSETTFDEHALCVAGGNLDRAMKRAPKKLRRELELPESQSRALWLLRNIYEHWDQLRTQYRSGRPLTGAAAKIQKEFPAAKPWSVTLDPSTGDITVGGVVSLAKLDHELRALESKLSRMMKRRSSETAKKAPR